MTPPEIPPQDFDALEPPDMDFMDLDYQPLDDLFPDGWLPPDERFVPTDRQSLPDVPVNQDGLQGLDRAEPLPANWSWHDAQLVGLERNGEQGSQFEIGCVDLYADGQSGDLGGSYLPIARFGDVDVAAAYYHELQQQIHETGLAAHDIPAFAERTATSMQTEQPGWQSADPAVYQAYHDLYGAQLSPERNDPPDVLLDPLFEEAAALGGVSLPDTPSLDEPATFQALNAIGIQAEGFDLSKDPPPIYDLETGTAYWIGVFQPDKNDRDNCVTSILSLGRDPETGTLEAQLAPCVPGDWDKAYSAAEYLMEVAQKDGIDRCLDAAEGMALATDQRARWETERGLPLDAQSSQDIADYAQTQWEVDL